MIFNMTMWPRTITNPSGKIDVQKIFATRSDKKSIMVSAYVNGFVEAIEFKSTKNLDKAKDKFISSIYRDAKYYSNYSDTSTT